MIMEAFFFIAFGLALGSFLNLTIDRLPRGESLVRPPSHCDACNRRLAPMDLLPVISHLWLKGRCRHCGYRISWRSPLVEVITAVGCGIIGYHYGFTPAAAVLVLYLATAIHLVFVDLEHSLILNSVVFAGLAIVLATLPFSPLTDSFSLGETYLLSLSGAAVGFGIMLLIYLASRGRMGAGDVKLAALLGAIVGFPHIIAALMVGLVFGGLLAVALLVLKLRGRADAVPLAPMLLGGAGSVLVTGTTLFEWYVGLFI
jgi:leader peptidase (prepilin peptidase) / N-methyltransferase